METKKEIKFTLKYSSINVIKFSQYDISDFTIKDEDFIEYENNFEIRVFDDTKEIGLLSTTKLKVLEINEILEDRRKQRELIVDLYKTETEYPLTPDECYLPSYQKADLNASFKSWTDRLVGNKKDN